MRLLVFLQGGKVEDQIGYHSGFETLQAEGALTAYKAIPWRGHVAELGWQGFCEAALKEASDFCPDAVYFQFFHAPDSISLQYLLMGIQKLPSRPIIAISGGDAFGWHRWMKNVYPSGFLAVAKIADVTFVTAMGECAAFLERRGSATSSSSP